MGIIDKLIGGGLSSILDSAKGLIDEFHLSGEEKQQFKLAMETLFQKQGSEIEQTIRSEMNAKMQIIVSEMQQGDKFTKRARPMVVYVGLAVIVLNYCVAPILAGLTKITLPALALPVEFWAAWGGIVATWSIGRSAERRGAKAKSISLITGNQTPEPLID